MEQISWGGAVASTLDLMLPVSCPPMSNAESATRFKSNFLIVSTSSIVSLVCSIYSKYFEDGMAYKML
jgi:uncharacterized protein YybS (DUF2232 family)